MSILVAKHIKSVLSNPTITAKVGDEIYLEGLNREPKFPFIVFDYRISEDEGTKDYDEDICETEIFIFSRDGDFSLELANDVRKLMTHSRGDYDTFSVTDTEFVSYEGNLDEDIYVRKLVFNIKTN